MTNKTTANQKRNVANDSLSTKRFYLRTGKGATDRMSADIDLMGVRARLFINADHSCDVYKILRNNAIGKKPIATGIFRKHQLAGKDKMPDIQGVVQTAKGSKIAFVGWAHDTDFDPYYVIQIDEFVRAGKFIAFN